MEKGCFRTLIMVFGALFLLLHTAVADSATRSVHVELQKIGDQAGLEAHFFSSREVQPSDKKALTNGVLDAEIPAEIHFFRIADASGVYLTDFTPVNWYDISDPKERYLIVEDKAAAREDWESINLLKLRISDSQNRSFLKKESVVSVESLKLNQKDTGYYYTMLYSRNSEKPGGLSGMRKLDKSLNFPEDGFYQLTIYGDSRMSETYQLQTQLKFWVDRTAPVSSAWLLGKSVNYQGSVRAGAGAKLALAATDATSVSARIRFRLAEGEAQEYSSPVDLAAAFPSVEMPLNVTYNSEDVVGNAEREKSFRFFLDNKAPEIIPVVTENRDGKIFRSFRVRDASLPVTVFISGNGGRGSRLVVTDYFEAESAPNRELNMTLEDALGNSRRWKTGEI